MPIPTDTFWNIRKLNVVFAVSALALVGVTVGSILQDYGVLQRGDWRTRQRDARAWDAALTTDKIEAATSSPERQQQLKQLDAQIADAQKQVDAKRDQIEQIKKQIQKLESDRARMAFAVNTEKANVGVDEAHLQDALAASDKEAVDRLQRKLAESRPALQKKTDDLTHVGEQIAHAREEMKSKTAAVDTLTKKRTQLTSDADALRKKLATIQPPSLPAKFSAWLRSQPLMGFINPAEKPAQVVLPDVLTDVAFMKIPTVDRCASCHVNIAKKDFTEANVLAYLEEQAAQTRELKLPEKFSGAPTDPVATQGKPGAVAMIEFWHGWARKLAPDAIKRNATRLRPITATVGKTAKVTFDNAQLGAFAYDLRLDEPGAKPSTQPASATQPALTGDDQSRIFVELMTAWLKYPASPQPNQSITHTSADGRITVTIANVDEKTAKPIRTAAMRYPDDLRTALKAALNRDQQRLLNDRYRYAMVDLVNGQRKREGRTPLDPSPVLLAHPRLDLYCDADSKHPMESGEGKLGMGCTSCHDGSGQETNFVLAAHSPRNIYVDAKTGAPVLRSQLTRDPASEHRAFELDSMLAAVYPRDAQTPHASDIHLTSGETGSAAAHAESKPKHEEHADSGPIDYIDPATGARAQAVPQFTYWKFRYEPDAPRDFALVYHEWDWPMRTPEYLQANCARCHSDVNDIKEQAPVLAEGRYLFTNIGCVNCHQMDAITADPQSTEEAKKFDFSNGQRKVGTDLRHVTAKLSPAFINTWVWAPKSFRPSTKMPHFFMLENSSSDEEIRRTRQEARAITEYLVRTATPLPREHQIPNGAKGSAQAGQAIFNAIGCKGCHVNLNDPTSEKRGNKQVSLGEQWVVTDLVKNGKLKAELAQKLGKDPDAKALTDEARKLYDAMSYNERQLYVLENLEQLPGSPERPTYSDNSNKPIFTHHGPELSGVGTKLTAGRSRDDARAWLVDWVMEPRHYSDYTLMPRLRLTGQQALDLAEYLLSMKRTNDRPDDPWTADVTPVDDEKMIELAALQLKSRYTYGDALKKADDDTELTKLAVDAMTTPTVTADDARSMVDGLSRQDKRLVFMGKKLIAHYGCMSCHAINGMEKTTSPCANLSDWGQKQVTKLDYGYLSDHQPEIQPLPETSQILMVNGLSDLAPTLAHGEFDSSKHVAAPVIATWPAVGHTRDEWLVQKLKNTRVYDRGKSLLEPTVKTDAGGKPVVEDPGKPYDKLRMPTFYLSDEQVHAIATFVLSNRDRLVSEKLWKSADNENAKKIALGRELTTRYACVNCHPIEQNVPQVQQYYPAGEITVIAPPSLRGEGNKVQFNWLFNFFKNVISLRPRLADGIRMPTFPATDEEWSAIIAYFNQASRKESQDLKVALTPVLKYIDDAKKAQNPVVAQATTPLAPSRGGSTKPSSAPTGAVASATTKPLSPTDPWPGDDWFTQPSLANQAQFLRDWALSTKQIADVQLDPTKNKPDELGRGYRLVLFKAQFVQDLFDAPFPFVETPHPDIDDARFKQGEQLFNSMQCLACHVMGDPKLPGANEHPTAPNLVLAQQRLQRRWVRHWVQEPGVIQIGTAMPPFFTGQPVFDQRGQPWPRSQNESPATVKIAEQMFGSDVDAQTNLVLDFLYAAGARGYTAVKPAKTPLEAAVAAAAPPKPATSAATKPKASTGASTPPASASPAKNSPAGASTRPAGPVK